VCPSEYPAFLEWMEGIHEMVIYDADVDRAKEEVEAADVFFCLDFNAMERIDKLGELVSPLDRPKIMIDHHLHPETFPDFLLSDTSASSTCELIYDFIHLMGWQEHLDVQIGECIFTGIVTDTGSFKYSTSPKLYRTVAELVELGVNDYLLQDLITNNQEEKHLRLLGHCLYNRMEILSEYRTGLITLTKEDYARFDIQRGDTEGIVNYILRIRGIIMAAFITEQPTIVKISLRSKGDFSVQEIAQKHFKGGGHRNASGGASFIGLKATVKKFRDRVVHHRALAPAGQACQSNIKS
jgi:bifunctional oligoribonuclease and PAP phosphatase NrnA